MSPGEGGFLAPHLLLGGAALAAIWAWVLLSLVRPALAPRGAGTGVFVALIGVALFALQWEHVVFPLELDNPDESQMLAQAQAFLHDPIPWRGADGTTSGPLNSYLLMLPALIGLPLDYVSTHAIGQACAWVMLACGTLTLFRLVPRPVAGAVSLAPITFLSLTNFYDYVHYSSERLSIALAAGAIVSLVSTRPDRRVAWFAFGVLVGALPFAKMQSALLAVLFAGVGLVRAWRLDRENRSRRLAAVVAGGLLVPTALAALVVAGGVLHDFWMSYPVMIIHHLDIVDPEFSWHRFLKYGRRFHRYWEVSMVVAGICAGLLALAAVWQRRFDRERWTQLALAAAYLVVAHFTVASAQRFATHYFLYLFHPILIASGVALAGLWDAAQRTPPPWGRVAPPLLAAAVIASAAVPSLRPHPPFLNYWQGRPSPVSEAILRHARPGERMLVWGWHPRAYVETGLRMGTRDSLSQFSMAEGPLRDYYRQRMLSDFAASRPEIFVDAVAPGAYAPELYEIYELHHTTFPELDAQIEADYRLVEEVFLAPGATRGVLVFRRRDAPEP